jgi:glycosyltransferase involved in cell wall biosynthesis
MYEISAVIQAFNEGENLPKLFESLKGIEYIVLTDKTAEIARSLGANVITKENTWDIPTEKDVEEFTSNYGIKPIFKVGDKLLNGETDSNDALIYAKNDWCFTPDADEIVTWDLPEIKKLLPDYNQIRYTFCHGHDTEGKCTFEFVHTKLFRKSQNKWVGRIHGVLVPTGEHKTFYTDKMRLDHYQKPREYRAGFLARLEYSILKDKRIRDMFYLAREYFYHKRWEDSIKMFEVYHKLGTNDFDRGEAFIFKGKAYLM